MGHVQRVHGTQSEPHAMHAERIIHPQTLEQRMRLSPGAEIILAVYFEPAGVRRLALDHLTAMRRAQPDARSKWNRGINSVHARHFLLATMLPPTIFSQVPLGT